MRCGRRALRRKSSIEGRLLAPAGGRVRRSRWDRSEQVWLPVVDRPDIACSVDLGCGLVHHRREARRLVGSVQRVAVRKQYLAAGGGHRVAARWRDRVAGLRPRGQADRLIPQSFEIRPLRKLFVTSSGPKFDTHRLSSPSTVTSHGALMPPPLNCPMIEPFGRMPYTESSFREATQAFR